MLSNCTCWLKFVSKKLNWFNLSFFGEFFSINWLKLSSLLRSWIRPCLSISVSKCANSFLALIEEVVKVLCSLSLELKIDEWVAKLFNACDDTAVAPLTKVLLVFILFKK